MRLHHPSYPDYLKIDLSFCIKSFKTRQRYTGVSSFRALQVDALNVASVLLNDDLAQLRQVANTYIVQRSGSNSV